MSAIPNKHYILYGAQVSLFSGKTRSYLKYKQIPFQEQVATAKVVNGELYQQTGLRMIPVVKTPDGKYIQDTSAIMDYFEERFSDDSIYPAFPLHRLIAHYLELYADEWLLLPAMHYRWHYKRENLWFILKEFGASAVPEWPRFLQPFGALVPAIYFGRLYKPVLGISQKNRHEVEQFYKGFLRYFDAHLATQDFVFGQRPSVADFAFYGPLYAHLYRDPYSGKMMRESAPRVAQWVMRMSKRQDCYGEFTEQAEQLPEFILKTLQHMVKTQLPVLLETIKRVASRSDDRPNDKLPRFLGKTEFRLDKVSEERYINVYAQWMLQRPLEYFSSLSASEQASIRKVFDVNGLSALLDIDITHPIQRRDNKLYPVNAAIQP
ncbi:glutathione S-transferase N-terminal domain-containing protein [Ningiella sp. W23]|uniref:glutathione S-transferase N-terminal domain-containing protein n=1 Tax=Ningiella sp. W23 TaxID=3023715 RepID=UPI003757AEF5